GSRASDNGVNPTTSQNSTEHTRRSATGPPAAAAAPGDAGVVTQEADADPASTWPQAWQNRWPTMTGTTPDGQTPPGAPPSPQNLCPSPRDAPHRAHLSTVPPPGMRHTARISPPGIYTLRAPGPGPSPSAPGRTHRPPIPRHRQAGQPQPSRSSQCPVKG